MKTVDELIALDAKEFSMGPFKVEIAQANTVDTAEVLLRQAELETRIECLDCRKRIGFVHVARHRYLDEQLGRACPRT